MSAPVPFHLAFPVDDLEAARAFYGGLLECPLGRESERWIDFDFFGHQIVAHRVTEREAPAPNCEVDGDTVSVRHFGAVLNWDTWEALGERLRTAGVPFRLEPRVRFAGEPGEQGTFFVEDPAKNVLEFKAFRDSNQLFAR